MSDEKKKQSRYVRHWKRGIKRLEQAIEELKQAALEVTPRALNGLKKDIEDKFERAEEKMKKYLVYK